MTSPIQSKCVICTIHISNWLGQKTDREATDKFADEMEAERERIRIVKQVVDKNILKDMINLIQAAREYRRKNTVAWGDSGERLLAVRKLPEYQQKMIELKDKYDELKFQMANKIEEVKDKEKKALGKAWKESDYPTRAQLIDKFGFYSRIAPVSNGVVSDIRLEGYSESEMEVLRKEMKNTRSHQLQTAIEDAKKKLKSYLGHYVERLAEDTQFKKNLTENLQNLCDILEGFTMLDAELAKQVQEAKQLIIDPEILRNNTIVRQEKRNKANEILKAFK